MKIDDINVRMNVKKRLKEQESFWSLQYCFILPVSGFWETYLATVALLMVLNLVLLRPLARWFQNRFLVWMENIYTRQLRHALTGYWPHVYFGGTILLLIFSVIFYFFLSNPKVVFFPDTDPQTIFVTMELPVGTSLERTDVVSDEVENRIKETLEPFSHIVKSVTTNVGVGRGGTFENDVSPNKSLTSISFLEYKFREGLSTAKIMQEITEELHGFVGAKIYVDKDDDGPPTGPPINIDISGDEFDQLVGISEDFLRIIKEDNIPGIDELKLNINVNQPEMVVKVNRETARLYELSTQQIAMAFRNALYGYDAGTLKEGEEEYDIFIRMAEPYRNDVSTLMNQKVIVE
jgi:multidrug efflux pump